MAAPTRLPTTITLVVACALLAGLALGLIIKRDSPGDPDQSATTSDTADLRKDLEELRGELDEIRRVVGRAYATPQREPVAGDPGTARSPDSDAPSLEDALDRLAAVESEVDALRLVLSTEDMSRVMDSLRTIPKQLGEVDSLLDIAENDPDGANGAVVGLQMRAAYLRFGAPDETKFVAGTAIWVYRSSDDENRSVSFAFQNGVVAKAHF